MNYRGGEGGGGSRNWGDKELLFFLVKCFPWDSTAFYLSFSKQSIVRLTTFLFVCFYEGGGCMDVLWDYSSALQSII